MNVALEGTTGVSIAVRFHRVPALINSSDDIDGKQSSDDKTKLTSEHFAAVFVTPA
jgi:hypothetical protein